MPLKRKHQAFNTHFLRVEDFDFRNDVILDQIITRSKEFATKGVLRGIFWELMPSIENNQIKIAPGVAYINGNRVELTDFEYLPIPQGDDNIIYIKHKEIEDPNPDAIRYDDENQPHCVWWLDGYEFGVVDYGLWFDPPEKLAICRISKTGDDLILTDLRQFVSLAINLSYNSIDTAHIKNGAITTPKLADGSVATAKIQYQAVTGDKIAPNAIATANIINGAITGEKIRPAAISSDKLGTDAVTNDKIADNAVTSEKIANGAITIDKIADDAVDTPQIIDGAVTSAKLAEETVLFTIYSTSGIDASAGGPEDIIASSLYIEQPGYFVGAIFERNPSVRKIRARFAAYKVLAGTTVPVYLVAQKRSGSSNPLQSSPVQVEYYAGGNIRDWPEYTIELDLSSSNDYGRWAVWLYQDSADDVYYAEIEITALS